MIRDFDIRENRFSKLGLAALALLGVGIVSFILVALFLWFMTVNSSTSTSTRVSEPSTSVPVMASVSVSAPKASKSASSKGVAKLPDIYSRQVKMIEQAEKLYASVSKSKPVAEPEPEMEKEAVVEEVAYEEEPETEMEVEEEPEEETDIQEDSETVVSTQGISTYVSAEQFKFDGVIEDGTNTYKWYPQDVLPGDGLDIPGRHVEDGYVVDENGYVCLASQDYAPGTEMDIPVGSGKGKVYDYCEDPGVVDVYTDF